MQHRSKMLAEKITSLFLERILLKASLQIDAKKKENVTNYREKHFFQILISPASPKIKGKKNFRLYLKTRSQRLKTRKLLITKKYLTQGFKKLSVTIKIGD